MVCLDSNKFKDQRKLPQRQPGAVNLGPCCRNPHFIIQRLYTSPSVYSFTPGLDATASRTRTRIINVSQLGLQIAMLISLSEADRLDGDDEFLGKIRVCFRLHISLVFSRTHSLIIRDQNVGLKYPIFLKRRTRIHRAFVKLLLAGQAGADCADRRRRELTPRGFGAVLGK